MNVHNYEKLSVWQKSMDLVEYVYLLTDKFPRTEMYGLISQMRRCAVSIPSNIAEGSLRRTSNDFCQFLSISAGSAAELQTQIRIAQRLNFCTKASAEYERIELLIVEIRKMLHKLISSLQV